MAKNIHLVIIDPQNDFCDMPAEALPTVGGVAMAPALPVPGAHADMLRLADFIRKGWQAISDMSITLDSHHHIGIERPAFWRKADGSAVEPFTEIKAADVRAGTYVPRVGAATARVVAYLDQLEAANRYVLRVWPAHCEIGTWGHAVHDAVREAYNFWEVRKQGVVNKVTKGSNPWTEHYSAVMAEVPDANDPTTQLNSEFVSMLAGADLVLIAGEAGSHCVKSTVEHIEMFGTAASKLVLLTDCMSPVTGFEVPFQAFLDDMKAKGVRLATSSEMLGELIAAGYN